MDERRQHSRYLVNWKVAIAVAGQVLHGHAGDVSLGGLTLFSDHRLEEKTRCKIQFSIPGAQRGGARLVQVDVRVMNVVLAANVCKFRMGVQFLNLAPPDKVALEGFLNNHLPVLI
jgi:PilZ domain.